MKQLLLFASSGKTLGHYLKTNYLYNVCKQKYDCKEVVNPTDIIKNVIDPKADLNKSLYFANDSFSNEKELSENINTLVKLLEKYNPTLVFGDKLPNLMTACTIKSIPYISVSHVSQISHNLEFEDNPNLILFNTIWKKYGLIKPVTDESWFFYRNWGNSIFFADDKTEDINKLSEYGYKYEFIGDLEPKVNTNINQCEEIEKIKESYNFNKVILFTLSSYASIYSDEILYKLAKKYKNTLFIYPRIQQDMSSKINNIKNIYSKDFINYTEILSILDGVFCLPGNGTLAALKKFNKPICGLYVHDEQLTNAKRYKRTNFKYYPFDKNILSICENEIDNILTTQNYDTALEVKSKDTNDVLILEKIDKIIENTYGKK